MRPKSSLRASQNTDRISAKCKQLTAASAEPPVTNKAQLCYSLEIPGVTHCLDSLSRPVTTGVTSPERVPCAKELLPPQQGRGWFARRPLDADAGVSR